MLIILLLKVTLLSIYIYLQETHLKDYPGPYRFCLYLIAGIVLLFLIGRVWKQSNIADNARGRWIIFPLIVVIPPVLLKFIVSRGSVEHFARILSDQIGLFIFLAAELFVVLIAFALLKFCRRIRIKPIRNLE